MDELGSILRLPPWMESARSRDRKNSPTDSRAGLIWNCVQRQRRGFIPSLGQRPRAPIKPKPPALKARFINSENGIELSRAFSAVMLLIRFLGRLPQAVSLNDRQDYFGRTVNIAARVQGLATSRSIFATRRVVTDSEASKLLQSNGIAATPEKRSLRGIAKQVEIFEIP